MSEANIVQKPIGIDELSDGKIVMQFWTKRGDKIVVSAIQGDVLELLQSIQAQSADPTKPSLPEIVLTYLMNHHFSHVAALYHTSLGYDAPPAPDFSRVAGVEEEPKIVLPHGFPKPSRGH
jgi:hypothetical protein